MNLRTLSSSSPALSRASVSIGSRSASSAPSPRDSPLLFSLSHASDRTMEETIAHSSPRRCSGSASRSGRSSRSSGAMSRASLARCGAPEPGGRRDLVQRELCIPWAYRPLSGGSCVGREGQPCERPSAWLLLPWGGNSATSWPLRPPRENAGRTRAGRGQDVGLRWRRTPCGRRRVDRWPRRHGPRQFGLPSARTPSRTPTRCRPDSCRRTGHR